MNKSNKKYKSYLEIALVSAAFAALLVLFFRDALFAGQIYVERDLSRYFFPLRLFATDCIKSGIFPLWNPLIFCGNPLFASLQSSVLYPLSIIYYLGDFAKMFNVFIVAHFILAGIFTYMFLRQLGCSVLASLLSGIAFALSGYMTSVVNLLTTLSVVTWFPLAMLLYYRMIKRNGYLNAVLLGVVMTVMFLAGEPSILYVVTGLFFCGAVYFTIEEYIEGRDKRSLAPVRHIKNMFFAIAVFLGLSAFQSLPFIEFIRQSDRENISSQIAAIWNLPIKDTPGMILPFFHDIYKMFISYWQRQSWLDNYYVGILVFILFVICVFFEKSKRARAMLILGLVGFALSLGKDTVLFDLLYKFVPGFKFMRYHIRFFFIPTFAICVLAGMGLDYYSKNIKKDKRLKTVAFILLALAFCASIGLLVMDLNFQGCLNMAKSLAVNMAWHLHNAPKTFVQVTVEQPVFLQFLMYDLINFKRMLMLMVFFGILFFLGAKKEVRVNVFILPAFVFLAAIDVFQVNNVYSPLGSINEFRAPTSNVKFVMKEKERLARENPIDLNKQLFRICCSPQTVKEHSYVPEQDFNKGMQASKDRLISDRMMEFGIYDVTMYGSVYLVRNSRFLRVIMVDKRFDGMEKMLELFNIKYIASSKLTNIKGATLVNKTGPANLYETKKYLPRAFLVENAVVVKESEKIIDEIKKPDFDPGRKVILEEYVSVGTGLKPAPAVADTQPVIKLYSPNKIVIDAAVASKPKFLVLSDTYYPGWKATVDGKAVKVLRADYMFRAVLLEPGRHTVVFFYSPASFKIGIFISLATLIILTFIYTSNIIRTQHQRTYAFIPHAGKKHRKT
jgi:hypothetical protein